MNIHNSDSVYTSKFGITCRYKTSFMLHHFSRERGIVHTGKESGEPQSHSREKNSNTSTGTQFDILLTLSLKAFITTLTTCITILSLEIYVRYNLSDCSSNTIIFYPSSKQPSKMSSALINSGSYLMPINAYAHH